MESPECNLCGKCCHFEIPVSILDISRISIALQIDPVLIFVDYLEKGISEKTGLFKLKKSDSGICIFNNNSLCDIYDNRPNVCRFYNCKKDKDTWLNDYINNAQKMSVWEHAIASQLSKTYIDKNGTKWNESEFKSCIRAIRDNIVTKPEQKFRIGRTENNQLVGVVYDCESCAQRGCMAEETIITIDDINRILDFKKISLDEFFTKYIDTEVSKYSRIFKLKREKRCIFYDLEKHCTINSVKPMHCRFTSCPKKIHDPEIYECLYLGAGTIDEQFRHQVAISYTKKYIQNTELIRSKQFFDAYIGQINDVVHMKVGLEEFCENIARYRLVDDSWTLIKSNEGN